ncbi:hypothetical protein K435DRAFT_961082 [Dendrothele bispora CBS 962.96]|uniref:Fibronectin type-III domain-containing protein n=1 Tax=Dendrothele bispora (strain CBS 962.96) TaxID=1314807 RepID=A0A4S8MT96_DENBC|nr:hypothetical protein K435DRAFT_961082 [Dendrothele bispora CBS 962.96]
MFRKHHLELIVFLPFLAASHAMLLNIPTPADGFNALVTNGSATVSWTPELGDPNNITISVQDTVTSASFQFIMKVSVSTGRAQGILRGIPGGPHYCLIAHQLTKPHLIIANTSTFTVDTIMVSTTTNSTLVPQTTSTPSFSSGLSVTSTGQPSESKVPTSIIIGGTLGGIITLVFLVFLVFLLLRQRGQRSKEFLLVDAYSIDGNIHKNKGERPLPFDPEHLPYQLPISKSELHAQEQRRKIEKLDQLKNQQAEMMQQWAELRSQNTGTSDLSLMPSPHRTGNYSNRTDGNVEVQGISSRSEAGPNMDTVPLDPTIQRQLNEMSQRIEELEVEKEELMRELNEAQTVPPPGYTE